MILVVARTVFMVAMLWTPLRRWFVTNGLLWLYLALLSFALALAIVPLVRAYARWRGVLDHPSARKVHQTATPLLGGAAVYAAFAITVLTNFNFSRELKGVALGAGIVVAIGIVDDLMDLPAWVKLIGQLSAAGIAMRFGAILTVVPQDVPGSAALNVVVTALWLLTVTNAVQFLDGMDGLAAGIGIITGVFFSFVALQTGQWYLMFLSASLVGACAGFLPYNLRPGGATIFLGDGGATFIGFTLAGLAVMGVWAENDPVTAMLTPALILVQAACILAIVAVLEGIGRGRAS